MIDVGGVLVTPDAARLAELLAGCGLACPEEAVDRAVYGPAGADLGLHPDDDAETVLGAVRRYARRLGVPEHHVEPLLPGIGDVILSGEWRARRPAETIPALDAIARAGVPVVIVTNATGHAADLLRRLGIAQVGPGPGAAVAAVIDSGLVGVAKPDPRIFEVALAAVGARPERSVHVGDSVRNDVECAGRSGMFPVHFDPYGVCELSDHEHVRSLPDVLGRLDRWARLLTGGP